MGFRIREEGMMLDNEQRIHVRDGRETLHRWPHAGFQPVVRTLSWPSKLPRTSLTQCLAL